MTDRQTIESRSTGAGWWVAGVLGLLLVAAGVWIFHLLSAAPSPGALSVSEERTLDRKLEQLRGAVEAGDPAARPESGEEPAVVVPEIYREDPEARRLQFTEREINALIARDPALAGRVAVRLSPGQVSAGFRVDVPEGLPLLGGRSVRVQAGVRVATEGGRVAARLVGVSLAGVPLPSAWLGGMKDEDLLATSALGGLGAGIEELRVSDGHLELLLAR